MDIVFFPPLKRTRSSHLLEKLVHRIRSKHVSVPVLALGIACRRPLIIQYAPRIGDLIWLSQVAEAIGDVATWQGDQLHYVPRQLDSLEVIDISSLRGSLRQSILLAPLAMHVKELVMLQPSGDLIGKRPIDEFISVLDEYNIRIETHQSCMRILNVNSGHMQDIDIPKTTLQVASTGVTFVALAAAVNVGCDLYEIINASKDPEINEVLDSLGAIYFQDCKSLKITGSIFNNINVDIPIDRIAVAELVVTAALHDKFDLVQSLSSEIYNRNGSNFANVIDFMKEYTCFENSISLNAEQFPGISTDILPTICTSLWLCKKSFDVIDNIFEWRMPMLSKILCHASPEGIDSLEAGFIYDSSNTTLDTQEKVNWESDNIRQTSAGIVALTYPNSKISSVVESGPGICRAYVNEWFEAIELITEIKLNISDKNGKYTITRQV